MNYRAILEVIFGTNQIKQAQQDKNATRYSILAQKRRDKERKQLLKHYNEI